jgi:hypothetical protein
MKAGKMKIGVRQMRSMLRLFASAWLLCQLTGLIAAPVAACCPGVAPGQVCPMHHTREGAKHCVMRSDCGSSTAALLTLIGGVGLVPPPVAFAGPFVVATPALRPAFPAIARAERPEAPPPRA